MEDENQLTCTYTGPSKESPFCFQSDGLPVEIGHRVAWPNWDDFCASYHYQRSQFMRVVPSLDKFARAFADCKERNDGDR